MSRPADAFDSDLDYLWRAVGEAQDASSRSEAERAEARKNLALAASRAALLERQLAESHARERHLKAEAEKLRAAAGAGSERLTAAAAAAREAEDLRSALLRKESELAAAAPELEDLRARSRNLQEALAARDEAIASFRSKLAAIMELPEIDRLLRADEAATGKTRPIYEELLERLEASRRAAADSASALAAAAEGETAARLTLETAERELAEQRAALQQKSAELEELKKAVAEAAYGQRISGEERAALENRAGALKAALAAAADESASLRARLDASREEAERLRAAADEHSVKAQEQRTNFSGAVNQVFELQNRAAALKSALAEAQERSAAAASMLKAREADLEKVNGLLREAKGSLTQEKEVSRRELLKIKTLEAEIDALKTKLGAAADYSARLLKSVEERDLALGAGKAARAQDQKKLADLEIENEDLRRKNIKFTGLLKREQADFSARMLVSLERSAKELKNFNLRIPAAERKALEPALKTLFASVNLLKGWQEYLDPETPDMEDTDLASLVSVETGKWERAFKQRKIAITAAILNPRLRARLAPERVKMLFYNLIKNAYERLQQGGSLRVTLKSSEDGRMAVFTFEDTGPGFAREALDKLFAPFNTTDKGKAGIGLAVARRIAEKHGGTLEVSNKKERGAIVEVRLPLGV
ncbi:MAG: ATP-binding protein [Elusimicrobiales bacterium]